MEKHDEVGLLRSIYERAVPDKVRLFTYSLRHPEYRLGEKLSRISRNGIESFFDSLAKDRVMSGDVLEIGSGGRDQNFRRFASQVRNFWRSDIRLWPGAKIELICDCTNLPFPDHSLDGIICSEVLEHVPESRIAIEEIARTLKPSGLLAVTVPFFYQLHGKGREYVGDYWRYTPANLGNLLRKNFEQLYESRTHLFVRGDPFVVNFQTLWKRR